MSNIRGLSDLNKDKKEKNPDDRKTTDTYAGGASSGINIENPEDDKEGFSKQDNKMKITAWKNGFQIDDGEFRSLEDDNNKKFMAEVEKGYIPQELVNKGIKNLGLALEDRKKEEYKPPVVEKKFQAFTGTGQSLNQGNVSTGLGINKEVKFSVDNSKPLAKVNIRLHNGEVITQEFNLTHTLMDVRSFVFSVAPVNGTFDLVEGFPPKPLAGETKTIEELKIQGSMLMQKLT